jgi:hypothetical protein
MAERRAEMMRMIVNGHSQQQIAEHYGITQAAVSQQLKKANAERPAVAVDLRRMIESDKLDRLERVALAVMARRHYVVSSGEIVTIPDPDAGRDVPLVDDGPILSAIKVLTAISRQRALLFGLNEPVKTDISGGVTVRYTVDGVDMEKLR